MLCWHMRTSQAQSSTLPRPLKHSRAQVVQAVQEGGPSLTSLEKCLTSRTRHSQLQNSSEQESALTSADFTSLPKFMNDMRTHL